jgi:hypothetical protein
MVAKIPLPVHCCLVVVAALCNARAVKRESDSTADCPENIDDGDPCTMEQYNARMKCGVCWCYRNEPHGLRDPWWMCKGLNVSAGNLFYQQSRTMVCKPDTTDCRLYVSCIYRMLTATVATHSDSDSTSKKRAVTAALWVKWSEWGIMK